MSIVSSKSAVRIGCVVVRFPCVVQSIHGENLPVFGSFALTMLRSAATAVPPRASKETIVRSLTHARRRGTDVRRKPIIARSRARLSLCVLAFGSSISCSDWCGRRKHGPPSNHGPMVYAFCVTPPPVSCEMTAVTSCWSVSLSGLPTLRGDKLCTLVLSASTVPSKAVSSYGGKRDRNGVSTLQAPATAERGLNLAANSQRQIQKLAPPQQQRAAVRQCIVEQL